MDKRCDSLTSNGISGDARIPVVHKSTIMDARSWAWHVPYWGWTRLTQCVSGDANVGGGLRDILLDQFPIPLADAAAALHIAS